MIQKVMRSLKCRYLDSTSEPLKCDGKRAVIQASYTIRMHNLKITVTDNVDDTAALFFQEF